MHAEFYLNLGFGFTLFLEAIALENERFVYTKR